ncbi:SchA/CurD-like domain-containing protein [Streptomyces eurythermus]|uniref:SchA/CurD-like domain-containing protein n=1 Tax=Streptomyces eurythermus TaxID=42237 RepID=UPI0036949BED
MNRYALTFTVKPGSEEQVARILAGYRRPAAGTAPDGAAPLLQRTSVFMSGTRVVRVMDVGAELRDVLRHLAAQPRIRAVEEALDAHLTEPRDMADPAGLRRFAFRSALPAVLDRVTPPDLLPDVPAHERGRRHAVLYPVRPGLGAKAAELLSGAAPLQVRADVKTTLAATTVFSRGDVLVRLLEVDGSVDDALDHLARVAAAAPSAGLLGELLDTPEDLTTVDGFRRFLATHSMRLISDRRVGVPA